MARSPPESGLFSFVAGEELDGGAGSGRLLPFAKEPFACRARLPFRHRLRGADLRGSAMAPRAVDKWVDGM